jgi:hypothetical protein
MTEREWSAKRTRRLAGGGLEQGYPAGQAASLAGASPLTS